MKTNIVSFVLGVLITIVAFNFLVIPSLKAKDRSISDELYRIEDRINVHENVLTDIINYLQTNQK